jgi:hypothetical protein
MKFYMFQASTVPIIKSYQLYTGQLVCFMQVMWPLPHNLCVCLSVRPYAYVFVCVRACVRACTARAQYPASLSVWRCWILKLHCTKKLNTVAFYIQSTAAFISAQS